MPLSAPRPDNEYGGWDAEAMRKLIQAKADAKSHPTMTIANCKDRRVKKNDLKADFVEPEEFGVKARMAPAIQCQDNDDD